ISGITTTGGSVATRTLDLVRNLDQIHLPSVALALLALAIAVGLRRTPWVGRVSSLIAVGVPSALAFIFSLDDVATVGDVGEITGGVPLPSLPPLDSFSVELLTGAFPVAIIALIHRASVSSTVHDPSSTQI